MPLNDQCHVASYWPDFRTTNFTLKTVRSMLSCADATDRDPTPGFLPGPVLGWLMAMGLATAGRAAENRLMIWAIPNLAALAAHFVRLQAQFQNLPVPAQQFLRGLGYFGGLFTARSIVNLIKSGLKSVADYRSAQLSYITVVNQTDCYIRLSKAYAYKGEVIATFPHLAPTLTVLDPPCYPVGVFVSNSGWTEGSGSAIELVSDDPKFRIVIAAARGAGFWRFRDPTTRVSIDQSTPEILAKENDSSGVPNFSQRISDTNIFIDGSVEKEESDQGRYCHVRVVFRYA